MSTPKASSGRFRFTVSELRAVAVPESRDRVYVYDDAQPGLAYCLTAGGAGSFYLYRRVNGKPKRVRLGGFPSMSIAQARDRAREQTVKMDDGIDPVEQRKQAREDAAQKARERVTFADVFTHYLDVHAKPHKRTWREDEHKFNRDLKPLHKRPITDITRAEITALHTGIGKRAPGSANRTLALISKVLNHARDYFDLHENVAARVKKYPEHARERFLSPEELPRFFKALDNHPSPVAADLFRLLLFTGMRCGNVQRMRWEHIDRQRKVWTIPAEEFKNGRQHTVNLTDEALAVLDRQRKRTNAGAKGYVFRSYKSEAGYMKHPWSSWQTLIENAGFTDLRIHDLRHTAGAWITSTHGERAAAGALGHRSAASARRYAHMVTSGKLNPVRDAVNAAGSAMLAAGREPEEKPTNGTAKSKTRQTPSTGKRRAAKR